MKKGLQSLKNIMLGVNSAFMSTSTDTTPISEFKLISPKNRLIRSSFYKPAVKIAPGNRIVKSRFLRKNKTVSTENGE